MEYMLLIYGEEGEWEALSDDERDALYREYFQLSDDLAARGALLGSNELQPVSTATTVQVRDGETLVTDGPFAETKEVLGGYYLIDVPDLDAATEWAAKMPLAPYGSVEIRAVQEFDRA